MNAIFKTLQSLLFLTLGVLAFENAWAQNAESPFSSPEFNFSASNQIEFLPVREAYQPSARINEDSSLSIDWLIAPEYYLYRDRTFFDSDVISFEATRFEEGLIIDDEFFNKQMVVYRGDTEMLLSGIEGTGYLRVEAQGCADAGLCYPPTDFWFDVDTVAGTANYLIEPPVLSSSVSSQVTTLVDTGAPTSLLIAGLMAFLGGLILNLMPCVFPVLAIKALKISSASESMAERVKEASAYTAGILFTVLIIAGILILVRGAGSQVGWGFQLQSPIVVLALTLLFFVIGLSFSGWLEFGARFAGIGQSLTEEGKPLKSFFTGVLAMLVASPCSAPFMAAALGYAVTQPSYIALLVFACLGIGMAAPLIALYLIPGLHRMLPKPGPWMQTFRQVLAWPMYLTAIWLLWVLTAQIETLGVIFAILCLAAISFAIWINRYREKKTSRYLGRMAYALALLFFIAVPNQQRTSIEVDDFRIAELDSIVGGSQPVFLDVTADWCITCKFNERRVLYTDDIEQLFAEQNVHYMVADWTNENPDISILLDRYQRVGIPLYLYFPAEETEPVVLPQILTKQMINNLFQS